MEHLLSIKPHHLPHAHMSTRDLPKQRIGLMRELNAFLKERTLHLSIIRMIMLNFLLSGQDILIGSESMTSIMKAQQSMLMVHHQTTLTGETETVTLMQLKIVFIWIQDTINNGFMKIAQFPRIFSVASNLAQSMNSLRLRTLRSESLIHLDSHKKLTVQKAYQTNTTFVLVMFASMIH